MLIPQFSIRALLALTALAAVVAWVLQQAVVGAVWAQCTAYTLAFVMLLFLAYASLFLLSWAAGQMLGNIAPSPVPLTPSPFATTPFASKANMETAEAQAAGDVQAPGKPFASPTANPVDETDAAPPASP